MLLRVVGSVIVIAASTAAGYIFSRNLRHRPQELRELQGLLQVFENEISYMSSVLKDAFSRVHESSISVVGEFFKYTVEELNKNKSMNASLAWETAVRNVIKRTSLNGEDEKILISFGTLLGKSDIEGQLKNIKLTINQLKLQESKAEQDRAKNETMYKHLGMLAGAAIVIILL